MIGLLVRGRQLAYLPKHFSQGRHFQGSDIPSGRIYGNRRGAIPKRLPIPRFHIPLRTTLSIAFSASSLSHSTRSLVCGALKPLFRQIRRLRLKKLKRQHQDSQEI
jgi:hypothetical protein